MSRVFAIITIVVLSVFQSTQGRWHAARAEQAAAPSEAPHKARSGYVGDDACRSCHAEQFDTYHHTAHYLTSMAPSGDSILGSFAPGDNVMKTANPDLYFRMEARPTKGNQQSFFQTAVAGTSANPHERSEQFAFVIGSGEKGQTYLYWNDDQLFQLPVSWWAKAGWVNSPGYRDGFADFDRAIIPRCLECHASYFESEPPPINRYSTSGFSLGMNCEKCHGPGAEHVAREKTKSPQMASSAILNPAHFSRDRQMDLCAWCHAGHGRALRPSFSYRPGEPLSAYIEFPPPDPNAPLDVHGSQVELLKQSRCFQSSNMTCLTCHDVHTAQHDPVKFSERCLTCHKPDSTTFARADHPVTKNCIDCHMPNQETNQIVFDKNGTTVRPQIRNHWIRVYPASKQTALSQQMP